MKKLIAAILCVVMVISLLPMSAFAASGTLVREEELAKDLKALGIFKGVSETDFALDRAPTRTEALVMLIRVLGRESDALSKGGRHPFLDVPQWADKYVGYAYENNLTNGVSATKFGSNSIASASMYLTFVLRALGYSDKGEKPQGIRKGHDSTSISAREPKNTSPRFASAGTSRYLPPRDSQ